MFSTEAWRTDGQTGGHFATALCSIVRATDLKVLALSTKDAVIL